MIQLIALISLIIIISPTFGQWKYPESDPTNKIGWTPYWALWDEFNDDELRTDKWVIHSPELHDYFWYYGRAPGLVSKNNVEISKGRLYLYTSKTEPISDFYKNRGFDTFTVSMFHSKAQLKYGYSEIKAKIGTSRVSSSFWFWGRDDTDATEIDVFEQSGPVDALKENHYSRLHANRYIHKLNGVDPDDLPAKCNCAYNLPQSQGGVCHDTPIGNTWGSNDIDSFSDDWHIYGMHWTASKIRIYVDGDEIITMNNDCNKFPMWLFLNRATMPGWFGTPDKSDIPDEPFQIEYIRTWTQTGSYTDEESEAVMTTVYGGIGVGCICIGVCTFICVYVYYKKKKKLAEEIKLENDEDSVVNDLGDKGVDGGYDMSPVNTSGGGGITSGGIMDDGDDGDNDNDDDDQEIEVEVELEYEQTTEQ